MAESVTEHKHGGLTELPATAICGNDITSSCLYVSALATLQAGKLAWLALLIVAGVLFLFRKIYAEVVGALPLNGGAYNALLNTTSKAWASLAACLTLLSYMATAVISSLEGMHYAHSLWQGLNVTTATIVVLFIFMALTIVGIGESSKVAIGIFIFHLTTLSLLLICGALYLATNGLDTFHANWATDLPEGRDFASAIFFGFAAAMLGISGFESSANFVEEQAEGVFPKTLRNMWIAVSVFNPAMAVLALFLIPLPEVYPHKEALLSHMGNQAAGGWLATVISFDAVLVLSGAVLTSYVGMSGLVRRMTLDRCMPQFLLKTNRRGTQHRILVAFFLLCVSIILITKSDSPTPQPQAVALASTTQSAPNDIVPPEPASHTSGGTEGDEQLETLAGVYTISFLAVMALFAVGNILLKVKRERLPRPEKASWPMLALAVIAVSAGLIGNVVMNPQYFRVFLQYFIPTVLIVAIMLRRIMLLKFALFVLRGISEALRGITKRLTHKIRRAIDRINSQQMIFFTRGDNRENLNRAILYVKQNEHTKRIKVVTVYQKESEIPKQLKDDLLFFDDTYPSIDIEFVAVKGKFGPELIQRLSKEWKIPANFMFIGSPGDHFLYGLAELGGVRLII